MTHDELLATLKSENFRKSRTAETPYFALRAIVELHSPEEITLPDGSWGHGCECGSWPYPCQTIQAIEKELG